MSHVTDTLEQDDKEGEYPRLINQRVGYLEPLHSFGYEAARQHFGSHASVQLEPRVSHREICIDVARRKIHYGVVAVENVITGTVPETIYGIWHDAEDFGGVHVCGEILLPIGLFCFCHKEQEGPPTKLISHPKAIEQCSSFIRRLQKEYDALEVDDKIARSTAHAAEFVSQHPGFYALCSKGAGEEYGLIPVVPESIADEKRNKTRFWIIGRDYAERTGFDKSIVLVSLKQSERGALWRALGCFVADTTSDGSYTLKPDGERPNLLIAYAIPIPGHDWEYNFLFEFSGHIDDEAIQKGIHDFNRSGLSEFPARLLGSFPDKTSKRT